MRSKKLKKAINIFLVITLVLGLISTTFGTVAVVFAKDNSPVETTGNANNTNEQNNTEENIDLPDFTTSSNEMSVKNDVKIFSAKDSKEIIDSIVSVEADSYTSYNDGGTLEFIFDDESESLFGDLKEGDLFFLDGGTGSKYSGSYIMKADNIYESDGQTYMEVVQPDLTEAFDNIDVAFNDVLTEDNLVSSKTANGVTAYFGDVDTEISAAAYTESFDSGSVTSKLPSYDSVQAEFMANEYSTNPSDFIINLEYDLNKNEEKETDNSSVMETDIKHDCKIKGKLGIEDFSAYMVCDMPRPLQFNELMFGVRGKKVVDVKFDAEIDASFQPKATKLEYDGIFLDAEISGINEKWLPLGIWQFVGTTTIKLSKDSFEKARVAPSIFVMLYMDAEGHFELKFNAGFTHESTFNSGLSVYKNGNMNFSVVNYPYAVENGKPLPAEEVINKWSVGLYFDADASITLLGSSVQFYIAGINVGEISLIELGVEGDAEMKLEANSEDGITTSLDDDSASLYLRGFLKAIGIKTKASAEVEAFQRSLTIGGEWAFQLVDLTLFEVGINPDPDNKIPVSSKWVPAEFESVVCIVGDVSGSMSEQLSSGGKKIEALKEAGHVITNIVKNSSEIYKGAQGLSVVKFDDKAQTVAVPHNDYEFIDKCIDTLESGGGTNISSGLEVGIEQLMGTVSNQKVILLMTDGQDSGSKDYVLKQAKTAAENNIRIYTIGFGDSVNEELLQEIANAGNGEYRYSPTDSIVSIISGFLYTYESSRGEVLSDVQSTVSEGDTVTADEFDVPEKNGDLNAVLYWPGSLLELILLDPNGRRVDEEYPGAVINNETIPATVTVKQPLHGKWQFKVKGIETSYENEPYYAMASLSDENNSSGDFNSPLSAITLIGAYCIPVGVFMMLISVSLLILVNKKPKE